jgi:hypothetical protein
MILLLSFIALAAIVILVAACRYAINEQSRQWSEME